MTEGSAVSPVASAGVPVALAWRLAPLWVGLGSLVLSAIGLGRRSLTSVEATALATADAPMRAVISTIVHDAPGQAGHQVLLRLATIFGIDERTIRAPSAIAVALAAGLLVVLGTMLLGRVAGVVAGIALVVNAGVFLASREARPYALGILGIVVATLLLVTALERGGGWRWAPYALAAAALPLFHPLAASVLAAHGATLIARRERADLRTAGIVLVTGTTIAACLLAWMAADRFDASALGELSLSSLGRGGAGALGWNAVLAVAAVAGIAFLFRAAHSAAPERWIGVLIVSMIAAPIVVTLLAAVALPVHANALVLCAPGIALAVGAAALLLSPTRGLVAAGLAVLLLASVATISARLLQPVDEDWRALAAAVKNVRGAKETVVVLPEGSRAAFAYYAPYVATIRFARGDGAWIAVRAKTPDAAVEASRPFVATPRYALRRQFVYGDGLRLQHWVRP